MSKPFRKSGVAPYSSATAGGSDAVYHVSMLMQSDTTHVDAIWVGNLLGTGASIGAVGITSNISVHVDDGAGAPTGPALATWLAQTIPGDGFWTSPTGFDVALPLNRRIVISYSVPAGSLVALSPVTPWGFYSLGTTTVDPPPAITASTPGTVFWVMVDGQTNRPIVNAFGNSILAGSGGGVEGRAWDKFAYDLDACVCIWGVPGSTLAEWASGSYLPYSYVRWNDAPWALEACVNDLPGAVATMISNRDLTIAYIRSQTNGKGYINTCGPQASYSDPGEAKRLAYNADTLALGVAQGIYGIYDRAARQLDGGLADNADTTILYAPFNYDGIHLLNAGQAQEALGWEGIVDLSVAEEPAAAIELATITPITTHADDAVARLIGIYQGKPRLEALIRLLAKQIQHIEDGLIAILVQSSIDDAIGAQLDQIGDIVGQARAGQLDDAYRSFIKARIKVNYSEGKIAQLIAIVLLILGDDASVTLREYYPSGIIVSARDVSVDARILWRDFLHRAKGAAKTLHFGYSKRSGDNTIRLGSFYRGQSLLTTQRPGSGHSTVYGGGVLAGIFG
jgi:hypothetical protein